MISERITVDRMIYALVIALSLIALALSASSPSFFMDNKVVYQGF